MPLPGSYAAQTVCLMTTTLEQRDLMRQINVAMLAPGLPWPSPVLEEGRMELQGRALKRLGDQAGGLLDYSPEP